MVVWTPRTKPTTNWTNEPKEYLDFLLKEDEGYLLQENKYRILLEQTVTETTWTLRTKPTTNWTNRTKP